MNDPLEWFYEIPIVSRVYLSGAFLTTAACALDLVSPFSLYFNFNLIFYKGQIWRLVTNFMFFGLFSLDFLFHMYFLVRYCRLLEEGSFRSRTADFVVMLLFGATLMTLIAPFVSVHFLGSSLTFMMVYIWGRRNEHVRMSFLGLFPFTAPYLPWVLLSFSVLLGNSATIDLLGIIVGHLYYYLEDVYPAIAEIRNWRIRRIFVAPRFLKILCDPAFAIQQEDGMHAAVLQDLAGQVPFEGFDEGENRVVDGVHQPQDHQEANMNDEEHRRDENGNGNDNGNDNDNGRGAHLHQD